MGKPNFTLSRRHFLRGLGACVALPAFESLGVRAALPRRADQRSGAISVGAARDGRRRRRLADAGVANAIALALGIGSTSRGLRVRRTSCCEHDERDQNDAAHQRATRVKVTLDPSSIDARTE